MGDAMAESESRIEEMQRKLEQMAAREQALMTALNEALVEADRRLLDEVRSITLEHEARRVHIFSELQSLAERIGAFPASAKAIETVEYQALDQPASPVARTHAAQTHAAHADDAPPTGGDWRKATEKIARELDFRLNGAKSQRNATTS